MDEKKGCCARAIKCGLDISKYCIENTTTHVAVSYGTVSLALLGGHREKRTFAMNGACVDSLGDCLNLARSGDLVVTGNVYDMISTKCDKYDYVPVGTSSSQQNDGGNTCSNMKYFKVIHKERSRPLSMMVLMPSPSVRNIPGPSVISNRISACNASLHRSADVLLLSTLYSGVPPDGDITCRTDPSSGKMLGTCTQGDIMSCVPRPVREAVAANTVNDLSELRTVTTLFLKLDTYRTDQYLDLADLQPFFLAMQVCLEECGGLLRQFIIDDKGCVLIGLWGVPSASYAGNCSRAVRCAWMMKTEASAHHHSVSIGITTGSVYCGIIGTEHRRDYVAIGKSVNLSARLMSKANGRILLDESTHDKLPLDITYNILQVESFPLKGISKGGKYYSYESAIIPHFADSDLQGDKVMIISRPIRTCLNRILDILDTVVAHPLLSSSWSEFDMSPDTEDSASSPVLVIKGHSGSGKTATLHHFVRTAKAHLCSSHGPPTNLLSPLLVSVKKEDADSQYGAIRRLIEAVWICSGCVSQESRIKAVVKFMLETYPDKSTEERELLVFPIICEAMGFTWSNPAHLLQSDHNAFEHSLVEDVNVMTSLALFVLRSTRASLVALDDVHNMSPKSWTVVMKMCMSSSRSILLLTLSVQDAYGTTGLSRPEGPLYPSAYGPTESSVGALSTKTIYPCDISDSTFLDPADTTVPIR